jgi:hypothetical protein
MTLLSFKEQQEGWFPFPLEGTVNNIAYILLVPLGDVLSFAGRYFLPESASLASQGRSCTSCLKRESFLFFIILEYGQIFTQTSFCINTQFNFEKNRLEHLLILMFCKHSFTSFIKNSLGILEPDLKGFPD